MIFSDFKCASQRLSFLRLHLYRYDHFSNLLNGKFDNQWLAFTVGAKRFNLFIPNLDVSIEYSRVNPWNYENRFEQRL
ncbi:hypothetical protein MASR2M39_23640 [Ignavibacteriales bacterium]